MLLDTDALNLHLMMQIYCLLLTYFSDTLRLWFPFSFKLTFSLLVVAGPSFRRDGTALLSPFGCCNRCHHTGGTRLTNAQQAARPKEGGAPHLSEPRMDSGRVPGLPRNRSHSTWTWVSAFCTWWSAAAGVVWARLSEEMPRTSVSAWKQSRSHIQGSWTTPSLQRTLLTLNQPNSCVGLSCLLDDGEGSSVMWRHFSRGLPAAAPAPFCFHPGNKGGETITWTN